MTTRTRRTLLHWLEEAATALLLAAAIAALLTLEQWLTWVMPL